MLSSSARFASSRFLPARLGAIQPFSSLPVAPTAEQDPDAGINNVTIPEPQRTGVQASYKKGTGGRASFSGNVCTIFGTTGNIGKLIVGRLAKDGTQIIIPYRCDPYYIRHTKIQGELGQILFFPFDLKDENSIRKVLKYSNVVVNLIGRQNETKNYSFTDVHVDGARRLARLSREMGVERFIHFSALNATKNPEPHFIPGGSQFLRTKVLAEFRFVVGSRQTTRQQVALIPKRRASSVLQNRTRLRPIPTPMMAVQSVRGACSPLNLPMAQSTTRSDSSQPQRYSRIKRKVVNKYLVDRRPIDQRSNGIYLAVPKEESGNHVRPLPNGSLVRRRRRRVIARAHSEPRESRMVEVFSTLQSDSSEDEDDDSSDDPTQSHQISSYATDV